MPAFSARRIASSALCAALLLGVAAPAALAADTGRDRTQEAAPLSDTEVLRGQVKQLNDLSAMMNQVTALVDKAVTADNGQVSATEAAALGDAAKAAIARVATTMAAPSSTGSTTPAAPVTPAVPSTPTVSTNPAAVTLTPAAGSVRADGVTDALAALQQAVELALKAITSGDPAQVVPAVTGLLGALVNAVKEIAGATGLPIPNLPLPTTS